MRIRTLLVPVVALAAMPLLANATKIYSTYETARQALLKTSLPEVQSTAKPLATAARAEQQEAIAAKADAMSRHLARSACARCAQVKGGISNMEHGLKVPSLTTILRLAVALDCKVMDLVGAHDKTDIRSLLPK